MTSDPPTAMSPYDEIADWYDAWAGPDSAPDDPVVLAVNALMGDIAGMRVCDLGCGQGRATRRLADVGARVTGVDISARLLAIARRREAAQPRGVTYVQADARTLDCLADGAFDGVLCFMALMDIPDLALTVRSVARVLRPGGWFVFSIIHPCYNPPPSGELATPEGWVRTVRGYWDEGYWRSATRPGPPGKVGSYHRTLATYVNGLTGAGFVLEQVREPRAEGSYAERRPVWAEVPAALIARCRTDPARVPSSEFRVGYEPAERRTRSAKGIGMSNYVLVHGAWSGAFRWKFVRPLLWAAGHEVYTPSLTGLGDRAHLGSLAVTLTTHVQDIVNLIECEDLNDIVLVGHSYGGMPVTGAADRLWERIAHLVYVDAFLPSDAQSCWDLGGGGARPAEDEWQVPPPQFAQEQAGAPARRFAQPAGTLSEPVRLTLPLEQRPFTRTYIKATADPRPEPPRRSAFYDAADRVSRDPAWRYIEMPAGHSIPWTHPRELAGILLGLQ